MRSYSKRLKYYTYGLEATQLDYVFSVREAQASEYQPLLDRYRDAFRAE